MAGKNRIQSGVLKNDTNLTPDCGWIFYDIKTGQCGAARSRPDNRTEHSDGCGLSSAVGPQEAEYLAFLDIQIDAPHSFNFAEGFSQRCNFDD
jgi:stress response protein SCP2